MSGRLIVIEGLDGSGKATQAEILAQKLEQKGPLVKISFPRYDCDSSALIKMYLNGEIGDVNEVNAYATASFYAVDRYVSYKNHWEKDYTAGRTILADRYSTSNIIYQMAKLPRQQWGEYLEWNWDYEFNKLGLPAPDTVIYLDVPPEISQKLLHKRYEGDKTKKDKHEKNLEYLISCRNAAFYAGEKLGWHIINCVEDGKILPIEVIAEKIATVVL